MDWRSITFDWNYARALLVTIEEGSFSAAARALGVAQPTIGRQVAALEQELGVTLFERVGRELKLTQTGLELLEHVRVMADAANRISLSAAGQASSLEGLVSISASDVISTHLLPPIIAQARALHPGITIEIVASNRASDLLRREADIAVRNFQPTQPELFAKKIRDAHARLYAAPSYLESLGSPRTAAELSRGQFMGFDHRDELIDGLNALGLSLSAKNFGVVTDSSLVQWELIKQGVGIGVMMEEVGDAEPLVRCALESLAPITFPLWLVSHRELQTSRRVRVVYDLLAQGLAIV